MDCSAEDISAVGETAADGKTGSRAAAVKGR